MRRARPFSRDSSAIICGAGGIARGHPRISRLPPIACIALALRCPGLISRCALVALVCPPRAGTDTGAVFPGVRWALARDVKLALRSRAELGVQLLFYVIVVSLFPLATSPERTLLATMGPGVLWVAALLASLLSLPRLFAGDYADGTLEQIALSPYPLVALVFGKIVAHWLTTGLPVVAMLAPVLGIQYAMDARR